MIIESILSYVIDKLFIYQLVATLISYSTIRIFLFYRARARRFQLFKYYGIPGPEPRLLDGNFYQYNSKKDRKYEMDFEFSRKFGKTFGYFIGDEPHVYSTDLELLRQVFIEKFKSFKERSELSIETSWSAGILVAKHDRWKIFRKVMTPQFNSCTVRGEESTQFIEETIQLMLEYIEAKFKVDEKEINLDIHQLMKATTLHLISNLAIELPGVQVTEDDKYVKSMDTYLALYENGFLEYAIKFPFLIRILQILSDHFEHGVTMTQIEKNLNIRIDEGLKRLSSETGNKTEKRRSNIIDVLIKLHYDGIITRKEVIGNAEGTLLAGYETSSTTLAYIFWVLGKYPEIQEKLRSELMAHGLDSKYLEQVIYETMRIYPAVVKFTSRIATETVTVNNITLPKSTKVHHHSLLNNHNPEVWPEPEKFDPERFHEGANIHPCAFAPFGLGDRKCLGYRLAMLEIKMIVCDILLKYRITLKGPQKLDLVTFSVVITKPVDKIILGLEKL